MPAKKQPPIDFEKSIDQLNQLVEKMEQGNLPLEEALKQFETGITLIRQCQTALSQAEQKVKILMKKNGKEDLETFDTDDTK